MENHMQENHRTMQNKTGIAVTYFNISYEEHIA